MRHAITSHRVWGRRGRISSSASSRVPLRWMFSRSSDSFGVKTTTRRRPREMLTYHCCRFVAPRLPAFATITVSAVLPLRCIRNYGVTVHKQPLRRREGFRQATVIIDHQGPGWVDARHRDQFAVMQAFAFDAAPLALSCSRSPGAISIFTAFTTAKWSA